MTDMGNATIRWRRVEQGADGIPYPRYERDPVSGPGPGVILMHELFGVTAPVAWLGDALVDAGFTVWIPELFESPLRSVGGAARKLRSCMTREFAIFARNKRRGVASPLGDLSHRASACSFSVRRWTARGRFSSKTTSCGCRRMRRCSWRRLLTRMRSSCRSWQSSSVACAATGPQFRKPRPASRACVARTRPTRWQACAPLVGGLADRASATELSGER